MNAYYPNLGYKSTIDLSIFKKNVKTAKINISFIGRLFMANWMKEAVKRPGALRAKAKKAGGMKDGKISPAFIQKAVHSKNPTTRKQAVLAKTFKKLRGK
ncbi:MAG TPA: hypothetical protein VHZ76_00920 [Gammaproteobacteria bacterium]|nr:hypothetical protein [Gammaproteobacteria bacterium]